MNPEATRQIKKTFLFFKDTILCSSFALFYIFAHKKKVYYLRRKNIQTYRRSFLSKKAFRAISKYTISLHLAETHIYYS